MTKIRVEVSPCGIDGEYCQAEFAERIEAAMDVLYNAFAAMVEEGSDGRLYYRTVNNVPIAMSKRIERLARRGLDAVRALNGPKAPPEGDR